jgi:two-component system, OmpR family, alkaline phosphatase synthesis response regulator PhoP
MNKANFDEKMKVRVLIVDDEPDIVELLKYNLQSEGYDCLTAPNGEKALELVEKHKPDLILLDVMMPKMDGMEVCRKIKENPKLSDIFIIFLTARGEEYSEIAGFEMGADDYITKPIKPRLLMSRVKAVLKRKSDSGSLDSTLKVGNLTIDKSNYSVNLGKQTFELPRKEFELLLLLASKPGKLFTREVILGKIWGTDVIVIDRTIDVHIRKIREKIGSEKIKTIKGVGYKFEP